MNVQGACKCDPMCSYLSNLIISKFQTTSPYGELYRPLQCYKMIRIIGFFRHMMSVDPDHLVCKKPAGLLEATGRDPH